MNANLKNKNQLLVEVFMAQMHAAPGAVHKQPIPVAPIAPNLEVRKLRARLMLEECLETINKGLGIDVQIADSEGCYTWIDILNVEFVHAHAPNLIEIADGLADLEVVSSCGTATSCGIAMQPIFEIVANDNLLKFAPGHSFDAGGKLIKPKDHRGPTDLIKRELIRQGADI